MLSTTFIDPNEAIEEEYPPTKIQKISDEITPLFRVVTK